MTDMSVSDSLEKLQRLHDVSNQMASQHAFLRDRFSRRATLTDVMLMISAGALSVLTFIDNDTLQLLGFAEGRSSLIPGLISLIVFSLSVITWKMDWKERKSAHGDAASALAQFKIKMRDRIGSSSAMSEEEHHEINDEYQRMLTMLEPIPEKLFLDSKRHHKRKKQISKSLSNYPSTPIWLIRCKLRVTDTWEFLFK